jgi:uncharacterized protein (TIGR00299 family) protein
MAEVVAWLDASGGISGDMFLGACLDAGAPLGVVQAALEALALPDSLRVEVSEVRRGGLRAMLAGVRTAEVSASRHLADIVGILERSSLDPAVRADSVRVFERLGAAEARVHGVELGEVHFHEVGALDSIADIVGSVAALHSLRVGRLVCGPISLGGGSVEAAHGRLPIPGPAVLELLSGTPASARGGPVDVELATPTGVALAVTLAAEFGPMPDVVGVEVGVGAGSRDPAGHANVLRLVIGRGVVSDPTMVVIEANVDDLDPRVWPGVLEALLATGAADAWLTPILMKKGRPGHTLQVLAPGRLVDELETVIFATTTTIGLRRTQVARTVLDRRVDSVEVAGIRIRVKLAIRGGEILNAMPEYDDVVAAAAALNLPEREVLELARVAAADPASRR